MNPIELVLKNNFRYQTDAKNEGGMIAAVNDYDKFQAALKDAFGA